MRGGRRWKKVLSHWIEINFSNRSIDYNNSSKLLSEINLINSLKRISWLVSCLVCFCVCLYKWAQNCWMFQALRQWSHWNWKSHSVSESNNTCWLENEKIFFFLLFVLLWVFVRARDKWEDSLKALFVHVVFMLHSPRVNRWKLASQHSLLAKRGINFIISSRYW